MSIYITIAALNPPDGRGGGEIGPYVGGVPGRTSGTTLRPLLAEGVSPALKNALKRPLTSAEDGMSGRCAVDAEVDVPSRVVGRTRRRGILWERWVRGKRRRCGGRQLFRA